MILVGSGRLADGLAHALEAQGRPATVAAEPPAGARTLVWIDEEPETGLATLADMNEDEWARRGEQPLRRYMRFLQQARRAIGDGGGRILVLVPTTGTNGAAGLVPWATAIEGARSLTKAAARAWAPAGITITSVAVAPSLLAPGATARLERPGLPPMSFGRLPDVADLAALLVALLDPAWSKVTGATIPFDGGSWMGL